MLARILSLLVLWGVLASVSGEAMAQVLRRDPAEEPAPLTILGRSYAPDGQLAAGPFRLHPFLAERVTWNDNIYLSRQFEREDDLLLDTAFGVRTDWRMDRHEMLLGYQGRYSAYTRHSSENFLESRLDLLSQFNGDWLFLDVGNSFDQRKDPEPDEEDIISERSHDELSLHGGLYVERIGFELEYGLTWYDFVDPALRLLDHTEHAASLGAYYLLREDSQLTQKLYAFLELDVAAFRFPERILSDSNQAAAFLGLKGTVFDRLAVVLKLGYGGLDPADNGSFPDRERFRGLLYLATVGYQLTDEQNLRLSAYRKLQTAAGSSYRVFDRLEGSYHYTFAEVLPVSALLFIDHADPSNTRTLTRMGAKFGLEYTHQRWLSAGAEYAFVWRTGKRIPGTPSLDYRNHQIAFWVGVYI